MKSNRRNWVKKIGLLAAAFYVAKAETIATPFTYYFPDDNSELPTRLSSNENPYGPSPSARASMAQSINYSNRYQWQMIAELMSAITAKNKLAKDNVLIGAGSTQIIDTCIQFAALQKGNFILAEPTFSRWHDAAETLGLQKKSIPLTRDKVHDLSAMLHAITPDTKFIYICNPNNPTGTICPHNSLVDFIKEATKKNMVLVDEAYIDYAGQPSVQQLVTDNENLVVIKTFSKIYGLAGARIGYALAHTKTIEKLSQLQSGADIGISAVSLAGALASLKDDEFVKQSYTLNEQARKYTTNQLQQLNLTVIPSHTNFIYFSLENYKKDFFALLKAANIEGTMIFEEQGKWSRITIGTMQEMQKFIAVIK
jgi:histidinol-phosphate aminotransferase